MNATDLKLGSSTYFFLLFPFLVFTKCQVLNLRVGRPRDQVLQRPIGLLIVISKVPCVRASLDRSFPSHKQFIDGTAEGQEGRAELFRILALYANYNPQVSYCQGK